MTPDRDSRLAPSNPADDGFEDEEAPRSIFSATWFRVVLVVVGVAIIGAVSVPYVLDVVNPPPAPVAQAPPRAVPSMSFKYCPVEDSNVPFGKTPRCVLSQI